MIYFLAGGRFARPLGSLEVISQSIMMKIIKYVVDFTADIDYKFI